MDLSKILSSDTNHQHQSLKDDLDPVFALYSGGETAVMASLGLQQQLYLVSLFINLKQKLTTQIKAFIITMQEGQANL